jgi:hypothetical protein
MTRYDTNPWDPADNAFAQRIATEARAAAQKYTHINDACPYPWGSTAAVIFKREFLAARADIEAGDVLADQEATEPFCGCDLELTPDELESRRCACCGKAVVA